MTGRIAWGSLITLALCVGVTGTAAWGFWSQGGTGEGTAATGTSQALTLTSATTTTALYPGSSADVAVTISNPNPFPVTVPTLELDTGKGTGGLTATAAAGKNCTLSNAHLSYVADTASSGARTVPANNGVTNGILVVTLSKTLNMGLDAANACQGVIVTVHLEAGA